jgi:hypothetical protein
VEMSARIRTYVRSTMPQPTTDDATDASQAAEVETARIPMPGAPPTPAAFGPSSPLGPPPTLGPPGVFGPPGALVLPMRSSPPPSLLGDPGTGPTGTALVTSPASASQAPRPARFGLVVLVALLASVATLGLTLVFLAFGRRAPPAAAGQPAPTTTSAPPLPASAPGAAAGAGSAGAKSAGPSTRAPGSRGPARGKQPK